MWCLPRYFHRGAPKDEQGNDHTDPIPTSSTAYSGRSMSTATSSTVPSGSDHTGSINVSDMSAESIQRSQQYPSFSDRPANLRVFTFSELRNATRNLNRSQLVGEGGFGCVYRGTLKIAASPEEEAAAVEVAVKHLNRNGLQGHKEWLTEVNVLGIVDHPNLVKLIGYCAQDDERGAQRLLVYEYMPNRSVDDHLSGRAIGTTLSWPMRLKVALDAARGLKYLHEDMDFQIIFRDLKTSNILLDENWNAKLSDFGMARQGPTEDLTHVSTAVVGTLGYAAPEYLHTGRLNAKSDIWSYGVLLYELVTGRRPIDTHRPRSEQKLLEWVKPYISDTNRLRMIVDPRLEGHYNIKMVAKLVTVANRCLSRMPKARPRMGEVLDMVQKIVDAAAAGSAALPPLHYYSSSSREEEGDSKLKRENKRGFHGYRWPAGRGKAP
ncbi:serine/threonine-protein kinase PCRK1 [Lolium perenne]|uniref:serine/threonine-protein kinase PCRK1 n=1 Tax=Lolium perenne TaxID=4522 RepID=UPI0021F55724|nr:serine/threonine-protein kinase PCRK1-like [Lolium perenne]